MAYSFRYDPNRHKVNRPSFGESFKMAAGQALGQAAVSIPQQAISGLIKQSLEPGGDMWGMTRSGKELGRYDIMQDLAEAKARQDIDQSRAMSGYYGGLTGQTQAGTERTWQDIGHEGMLFPGQMRMQRAGIASAEQAPGLAERGMGVQEFGARTNRKNVQQQGILEQSRQGLDFRKHQDRMNMSMMELEARRKAAAAKGYRVPKPSKWMAEFNARRKELTFLEDPKNRGKTIDLDGTPFLIDPSSPAFRKATATLRATMDTALRGWAGERPKEVAAFRADLRARYVAAGIEVGGGDVILMGSGAPAETAPGFVQGAPSGPGVKSIETEEGLRQQKAIAEARADVKASREPDVPLPVAKEARDLLQQQAEEQAALDQILDGIEKLGPAGAAIGEFLGMTPQMTGPRSRLEGINVRLQQLQQDQPNIQFYNEQGYRR
jgi:hypothetical protein